MGSRNGELEYWRNGGLGQRRSKHVRGRETGAQLVAATRELRTRLAEAWLHRRAKSA